LGGIPIHRLYQYYTEIIDNENFDWAKQRPITQAYREMCDKFQPVEVLFLEEYIRLEQWNEKGIDGECHEDIAIPTMDLFEAYEEPIQKSKTMKNMIYRFVPDVVYETMEQRAMINSWKIDEAERKAAMDGNLVDAPEDYFV
jgi:hypothetical protein